MERMISRGGEVVHELGDARFVRHGRPRIRLARRPFRWILAVVTVDLIQPLGFRVVRFEVVIAERPCGRDAVDVPDLAEILSRSRYRDAPYIFVAPPTK